MKHLKEKTYRSRDKSLTCSIPDCIRPAIWTNIQLQDRCIFHMPLEILKKIMADGEKKYPYLFKTYRQEFIDYEIAKKETEG